MIDKPDHRSGVKGARLQIGLSHSEFLLEISRGASWIIVELIDRVLQDVDNENVIAEVRKTVNQMMEAFPMFAW